MEIVDFTRFYGTAGHRHRVQKKILSEKKPKHGGCLRKKIIGGLGILIPHKISIQLQPHDVSS